ncbi:MAG: peptidylprolyl isomerase [Desulfuromonadales bacterium]|nr:peptidylprolyl isomerase [Desulfuromonadales bacterium]
MFLKSVISSTIILITVLLGCARGEEINPLVGKTTDFMLRSADLERLISGQAPETQKKFQNDPEQRLNLVRQLLTQKAIVAKARKEGFDKKPDVKEQLSYVIDEFIAREYLYKVVAATATTREEDLKKYFKEKGKTLLIPEQIRVRHIFFEVAKDLKPDERNKVLSRAEATLQRLKKGEDFAKLAREVSEDTDSGKQGGELGTLSPGSTSSEDFEKAAFSLKAGEMSAVVSSPYGYHIIRVDERTEKRAATFEESREYIRANLQREAERIKVQEFIDQATKEAGLELFTEKITGKAEGGSKNDDKK